MMPGERSRSGVVRSAVRRPHQKAAQPVFATAHIMFDKSCTEQLQKVMVNFKDVSNIRIEL